MSLPAARDALPSKTPEADLPPGPYPPRLTATSPKYGEEVPTDAVLEFLFDQSMDRQSVELAFALSPSTPGVFDWTSDRRVSFTPESLLPGHRYVASLGSEAKSAAGLMLTGDPQTVFRTVSPLQVTRTMPADGASEVWTDAHIVIEFNRPVVPTSCTGVAAPGADDCPSLSLSLTPKASGTGAWIDPSTYRFVPSAGLQAGKLYALQVETPVTSTDGAVLDAAHTWGFVTAAPRVISVTPAPGARDVLVDSAISVRFSTPMDRAWAGGAFSLLDGDGQSISGSVTWKDNGTTLVFTPTARLQLQTSYTAAVGPGARASTSAPLVAPYAWGFDTILHPQLLYHTPGDDGRGVGVDEVVHLTFSGEIDTDALTAAIRIVPEPSEGALFTWHDATANSVTLSWRREPRTETCIAIDPELTDVYGNQLPDTEGFCFQTGDLPPELELYRPSDVVTLSANRAADLRLLLTNVTTARFSLARIGLPEIAASDVISGEIVREWTATFAPELNVSQAVTVSLDRLGGPLPSGLYALTWQLAGQDEPHRALRIAVVDRAILVKVGGEEALVWVSDISSGAPVTRTAVQLLDRKSLLLAGGTTDDEGLLILPIPARGELWEPVAAVTGEPGIAGFGIALTTWQGELPRWSNNLERDTTAAPPYRAYVQLDQLVYRAGDVVDYVGALRRDSVGYYELPEPGSTVVLDILSPSSESMYTETAEISASGLFSGVLALSPIAPPGNYKIQVTSGGNEGDRGRPTLASAEFVVAAHREPSFEVDITTDVAETTLGVPLVFRVRSEYRTGRLVVGGAVEWTLSAAPYDPYRDARFASWSLSGWHWGTGRGAVEERVVLLRGSGVADRDGVYIVELPADTASQLALADASQTWLLEATVTDQSGQRESGAATVLLHPANCEVALRPESWVVSAGERDAVAFAVTDWLGTGVPNIEVAIAVARRVWSAGDAAATGPYTDTLISEQTVPTDADGLGTVSIRPTESGTYIVTATVSDRAGRRTMAELTLHAGADAREAVFPTSYTRAGPRCRCRGVQRRRHGQNPCPGRAGDDVSSTGDCRARGYKVGAYTRV